MRQTKNIAIGRDFYVAVLRCEKSFSCLTQEGAVRVDCKFYTSASSGVVETFVEMTVRRPKQLLLNIGSPEVVWAHGHKGYVESYGHRKEGGWWLMTEDKNATYREIGIWPIDWRSFTKFSSALSFVL